MRLSIKLSKLKKLFLKRHQKKFLLIFLILLYLVVRLYQLPLVFNFSMDQGTTLLKIYELWQEKKFTLIGPESSLKTINGLSFFHGPWIYYFLFPFLLIGNWHPLAGAYAFIALNLIALIILFVTLKKYLGLRMAFLTCLIFCLNYSSVRYSQFFWNPNLLIFISCLLISLGLKMLKESKLIYFFISGLVLGAGLGCHYQTIILTLVFFLVIIFSPFLLPKLVNKRHAIVYRLLTICLGLILGLSPLIIFELKHNFYNLKVLSLIFTHGLQKSLTWPPPAYYFLAFLPFFFIALAGLIKIAFKKNYFFGIFLLLIYTLYSLSRILPLSTHGFTMPEGWNFLGINKASKIIIQQNLKQYNIASLLSGDTRDYSLRCLLTISSNPPLSVESYPAAHALFVISKYGPAETIQNPVWEISSFCPCKLTATWKLQNNINLYLLEKISVAAKQNTKTSN